MFLETTPEGKIYKELAADHFADPKGLGKYALFLRPSQGDLIPAPQMEPSLLLSGRYRPERSRLGSIWGAGIRSPWEGRRKRAYFPSPLGSAKWSAASSL